MFIDNTDAVVGGDLSTPELCVGERAGTGSFAETGSGEHYEEAGMSGVRTYLQHAIDQIVESDVQEQQKKGSLYLLNLKEVHGLSQTAVHHVVKETQKVFRHSIAELCSRSKIGRFEMATNHPNVEDYSEQTNIFQFWMKFD